jgi:hypothetical protein
MNIKTILVGLSLLVLIFCSAQSSYAAVDEKHCNYIYLLAPPSEHPWQDSGSPPIGDDIRQEIASHFMVINGPWKIFMFMPSSKIKLSKSNTQMADNWSDGKTPR